MFSSTNASDRLPGTAVGRNERTNELKKKKRKSLKVYTILSLEPPARSPPSTLNRAPLVAGYASVYAAGECQSRRRTTRASTRDSTHAIAEAARTAIDRRARARRNAFGRRVPVDLVYARSRYATSEFSGFFFFSGFLLFSGFVLFSGFFSILVPALAARL